MFKTIKSQVLVVGLLILSSSSTVLAHTVAQPGKMCSYDIVVPSLSCMNPDGGEDVRLYIMEFQDCKNGNITNLDRSISGHVFSEPMDLDAAKVDVVFSGVRTHFDDRVDDLTFEMPKSAVIQTKLSKYVLNITSEIIPLYEGADVAYDWAYGASFKKVDAKGGTLSSGRLVCTVNR